MRNNQYNRIEINNGHSLFDKYIQIRLFMILNIESNGFDPFI